MSRTRASSLRLRARVIRSDATLLHSDPSLPPHAAHWHTIVRHEAGKLEQLRRRRVESALSLSASLTLRLDLFHCVTDGPRQHSCRATSKPARASTCSPSPIQQHQQRASGAQLCAGMFAPWGPVGIREHVFTACAPCARVCRPGWLGMGTGAWAES